MESTIRNHEIPTLKAQLIARQHQREAIAKQFESPNLTSEERTMFAILWDEAVHESHELLLRLDSMERQENATDRVAKWNPSLADSKFKH